MEMDLTRCGGFRPLLWERNRKKAKYNAVSAAGLLIEREEGRNDKTTHKLTSSRTSCLSYFLIQRKEARMFWRLLIRDKDDRVKNIVWSQSFWRGSQKLPFQSPPLSWLRPQQFSVQLRGYFQELRCATTSHFLFYHCLRLTAHPQGPRAYIFLKNKERQK